MRLTYPDNAPPINVSGVPDFATPPGQLPDVLQQALDSYQTVRSEHGERLRHLNGSYRRIQDARQRDIDAARRARRDGKAVSPHSEADAQKDQDRTLLELAALHAEAAQAEQAVRRVASEVEADYRASLDERSQQARDAVHGMVEEIKARLTELRAVAACQHWLDQVTASPPVRVKQVGVDTSGIDEALAPIGKLLSGASGEDLAHFLAKQRQGTSGQAFTITPGAVSNPTAGR